MRAHTVAPIKRSTLHRNLIKHTGLRAGLTGEFLPHTVVILPQILVLRVVITDRDSLWRVVTEAPLSAGELVLANPGAAVVAGKDAVTLLVGFASVETVLGRGCLRGGGGEGVPDYQFGVDGGAVVGGMWVDVDGVDRLPGVLGAVDVGQDFICAVVVGGWDGRAKDGGEKSQECGCKRERSHKCRFWWLLQNQYLSMKNGQRKTLVLTAFIEIFVWRRLFGEEKAGG